MIKSILQRGAVSRIALAAVLFLSVLRPPVSGQGTDPFYHKWLESGEDSYFSRSYDQAVESLEIAVFGLGREKEAQARGYVFLALTRAALGKAALAAAALASAAENIGWDGLKAMDLRAEARRELDKLLVQYAAASPAPTEARPAAGNKNAEAERPVDTLQTSEADQENETAEPEPRPTAAAPTLAETGTESGAASIGDLREAVEADPRDTAAHYGLASLYLRIRDYPNARAILERLIDRVPAEIRAYMEIGRVDYLSGDAKRAVKNLEKFLALTENVPVERHWRDEGLALLLLSASARGDRKKVARLLAEAEDLFLPERLAGLTLDPVDLESLRTLHRESGR